MKIYFCATDHNPEPWLAALREALARHEVHAEIEVWASGAPPGDYALVWAPPQQFLDEQSGLRALFNLGAGVDALMRLKVSPATAIVRLDDAGMSVQMTEYVVHALIRHFREFDGYEADMREGRWSFRRPRLRADWPVGVMGLGVLGRRVAQAVGVFDFPVLGWSRSPKQMAGVRCFAGREQLVEFLAATRVLVCMLPLTAETEGVLNRANLSHLMPGGYLINPARGGHVVENDLLALIDEGHLAGAALDVFRQEPLPAGHAFWNHPKITLTPHTAARTLRDESVAQIAGKIAMLTRGAAIESIAGVVDTAKGY